MNVVKHPKLTFFCELDATPLQTLFDGDTLITQLRSLDASVSMGLRDLSEERAEVVQRLNTARVPMVAWLLLPEEQGYWFNLDNASHAIARYETFKTWSAEYGLHWEGIGLDIEPNIREIGRLAAGEWTLLPQIILRLFDAGRYHVARARYTALVKRIRADGYRVDSYHIPFVIDERKVGSTLLQRLFGLIDMSVDREVLMLYSSFMRPRGHGILWSYAPVAQSIAVGSTGGGVTVAGADQVSPLTWDELTRDLLLAQRWSDDIHIFSLEGAVREGYLARLCNFDWTQPISPPLAEFQQTEHFRRGLRAVLWASAHPGVVLAGVAGILWLASCLKRRHKTP
ncbi:MAG: hypothetical protein JXA33_14295 [Anaerolineae bacterium]|nr:hypothetical protein [Anaerolineae bacterium]